VATFTISLTVGAQTFSYSETVTDTNAQRIAPAYRKLLGLPGNAANQQIWNGLGASVAAGIKANVISQEHADAVGGIIDTPMT